MDSTARRVSVDSWVGDWNTFYWLITNCIQLFEKKGARKNMQKSSGDVVFPSNLLHQVLFFLPNAKKRSTQLSVLRSFAHLPRVTA